MAQRPSGHAQAAWRSLPLRAKVFRVAHVVWGIAALCALAYIWACAITRRRDHYLRASVALLLVQGVALFGGRGNCPCGPFQRNLGDPVPMFELVLPPRAAKAAIPILFSVAIVGMAAVLLRPPDAEPTAQRSGGSTPVAPTRCPRRHRG